MGLGAQQNSRRDTLHPGKDSPASRSSMSSHKPKSNHHGGSRGDRSSVPESTVSSSSHRKTGQHQSSRSHMDSIRPTHASGQRESGHYENSRSTLRPTEGPSRNDYCFSPEATRNPGESYTQTSSRHTGATGTSRLANGQLVKTREVRPTETSVFPGSSVAKDLVRVPGSSRSVASTVPSRSTSNGHLHVPGSSRHLGTVDASSDAMEISSFTSLELTRSDGSKLNIVHGVKIKIPGKSKY